MIIAKRDNVIKRLLIIGVWLISVLAMIGVRSTGRAQSFTAGMYLPAIRYDDPCAASSMPLITRPPTPERIAFFQSNYQSPPGVTPDLYIANADNTGRTRLTNDSAVEGRPTWSPDGTRIAYASGAGQSVDLKVLQLSNQHATSIYTWIGGAGIADPAWSPDGKQIAFTQSFFKSTAIYIVNLDGSGYSEIGLSLGSAPSWAPR